jgi:hypothetical protein
VVELALGIDRERRRALVVEGTQADIARAHAPQVGAGADQLDHVDRLLDALDALLRVQPQNPCGSDSSENALIA